MYQSIVGAGIPSTKQLNVAVSPMLASTSSSSSVQYGAAETVSQIPYQYRII